MILNSRIYYEFLNLLFTLEHIFGTPLYRIGILLPSSNYASPYCYICKKTWMEILNAFRI